MSLIINNELKLIFIHVPKNAGGFIRKTLLNNYNFEIYDILDELSDDNKRIKKCINIIEFGYTWLINTKLQNYDVFCIIRNPYERFISGYLYIKTYREDIFTIKDLILNKDNLKNGIFKNTLVDLDTYCHIFITQSHFINGLPNLCILNYDNLNYNLCNFLLKKGITTIQHENIILNSSLYEKNGFWEYIDSFSLNFINTFFYDDFNKFGFEIFKNIFDFYYFMNKKYISYKIY